MKSIILLIIIIKLLVFLVPVQSSSVAGQETLIGIVGRDYIILGTDSSRSSSISVTSSTVDKIKVIIDPFPFHDSHEHSYKNDEQQVIAIASAGDNADSERLLNHLTAHASSMEYQYLGCDVNCLYHGDIPKNANANVNSKINTNVNMNVNDITLSPGGLDAESIAYLARGMISQSLRSRGQLKTCLLVAGMVRSYESYEYTRQNHSNLEQRRSDEHEYEYNEDGHDGNDGNDENKEEHSSKGGNETNNSQSSSSSFSYRIQQQVQTAIKEYVDMNTNTNTNANKSTPVQSDSTTQQSTTTTTTILKPKLFWLDEYGSLQNVEYAAHGMASNFALSILDRKYNSNMSREDAIDLVQDCFQQLRKRFVINSPMPPCVKCIDANGCHVIL
jgi:20S proteasome alpha/beta subunit